MGLDLQSTIYDDEVMVKDLLSILFKHRFVLIITFFIAVGLSGIINYFFLQPVYESQGKFSLPKVNCSNITNPNDILYGLGMVDEAYKAFALSDSVLSETLKRVGKPKAITPKYIRQHELIRFELDSQSLTFDVTASAETPGKAKQLLIAWHDAFDEQVLKYVVKQHREYLKIAQQQVTATEASLRKMVGLTSGKMLNKDTGLALELLLESSYNERYVNELSKRDNLIALQPQLYQLTRSSMLIKPDRPKAASYPRKVVNMLISGLGVLVFTAVIVLYRDFSSNGSIV